MKRDFYHEYRAVSGKTISLLNKGMGGWSRKGASMWTMIEEPVYYVRVLDNKPMLIYTASWGSVYLIYQHNKPGDREVQLIYPDIAAVLAEGTKAELWDLFIALGRMEVSK